jgi:predicted RNase H-like HicB family nuclease
MNFTLEFECEEDGRWIAEVLELPGVLVYGMSRLEAKSKVEILALRVLEDRVNLGQS